MTPDEWRVWRHLRLSALAQSPGAFSSTLSQWSGPGDKEERWRARLRGVPLNLAILWDGAPVGMVSAVAPDDEGRVELVSMWIAPTVRGRGVGDQAVRPRRPGGQDGQRPCHQAVRTTRVRRCRTFARRLHRAPDAPPRDSPLEDWPSGGGTAPAAACSREAGSRRTSQLGCRRGGADAATWTPRVQAQLSHCAWQA